MAVAGDGTLIPDLLDMDGADEDLLLMRETLGGDDQKPIPSHPLFTQESQSEQQRLPTVEESIINRLLSAVYSGPTLGDIENALSASVKKSDDAAKVQLGCSRPSFLSKGLGFGCSRMQDNKYTVRIKSSGAASGGMADDGYKWRKYGQKSIKNSPYPRSYYRCTNPRCNAKKQVERSADDPTMYVVTYEGLHLHYAYPQLFVPGLTTRTTSGTIMNSLPAPAQKRVKIVDEEPSRLQQVQQLSHGFSRSQAASSATHPSLPAVRWSWTKRADEEGEDRLQLATVATRQQQQLGLLEDIVPLVVRNPVSISSTSTSVGSHHKNHLLSSNPSSPTSPHFMSSPSSSSCISSSLSWSPTSFAKSSYQDVGGILSSAAL